MRYLAIVFLLTGCTITAESVSICTLASCEHQNATSEGALDQAVMKEPQEPQ